MMAQKLYIPTTTLNFNNIMSSESISPCLFYHKRRYGYKIWDKVAPNPYEDKILLYDYCPIFQIDQQGIDSFPLVIEIDKAYLGDINIIEDNGIFYSEETIYLNPYTTRFIFFDRDVMRNTILAAQRSIESKLVGLYKHAYCFLDNTIVQKDWIPCSVTEDLPGNVDELIQKDISIDKIKGLLYGFLIGHYKSISPDYALLRSLVKKLRNQLASIITSENPQVEYARQGVLDQIYASINETLFRLSGASIKIDEYFATIAQGRYNLPLDSLKAFLRDLNVLTMIEYRIADILHIQMPRQIEPFSFYSGKSKIKDNKLSRLNNYIEDLENRISRYQVCGKVLNVSELPSVTRSGIVPDGKFKDNTVKVINAILDAKYNKESFLSSRYKFAVTGGKIIKEILNATNEWENSETQVYINSLFKNLNEHKEFDLQSTKNNFLRSFAAFCQKGDTDITGLEDHLIENQIVNMDVAFMMWGTVFGFAEMPKTYTNYLFSIVNEEMLLEYYRHIHFLLHNVSLPTVVLGKQLVKLDDTKRFDPNNKYLDAFIDFVEDKATDREDKEDIVLHYKAEISNALIECGFRYSKNCMSSVTKYKDKKGKSPRKVCPTPNDLEDIAKNTLPHELATQKTSTDKLSVHIDLGVIEKLKVCKDLSPQMIDDLKENWEYAYQKYPGDRGEQIRYFINLSKSQGRKSSLFGKNLYQNFDDRLARDMELELKRHYGL